MRYIVINYKGGHSISNSDRDLIGYEFSDDLKYLRDKYSLPVITHHLNWRIEEQGFSLYHKGEELGILLVDNQVIKNSPFFRSNGQNSFTRYISQLINSVMRDLKIEEIIN